MVQWNGAALSYDATGNLTSDGSTTYNWNARNQLASISGPSVSAAFPYDSAGKRTATQINTRQQQFLCDGFNVIQEQSGVGSVTAKLLTGFGVDENYARADITGTQSFLSDGINSTVALSNESGNVSSQYTYDPFGNTTQSGNPSTNSFQFTGRENDGTGLYYLRARYYSPSMGRFISQDPIGARGGINLYAYAAGNPVSLIDPFGTDPGSKPHPCNPAIWPERSCDSSGRPMGPVPGLQPTLGPLLQWPEP
jgi:RHS repeat-associated protein